MIVHEEPLRKHQPDETPMLSPRLGGLSGLTLLALAVLQLAMIPAADPALEHTASQFWVAAMWAGWSVTVWILIQPPLSALRLAAAGLLLAWHCVVMEIARQQPLERYVIMFAGFGVWQTAAAVVLRLPRWQLPQWSFSLRSLAAADPQQADMPEASSAPRPGQFGILSILVLMTVSAGVLLAVRRYGDAAGEEFFSGAVLALLLLAIIAANAMVAATMRRWGVALLPLMLLVTAASASVMAAQEVAATGARDFAHYWRIYFTIEATFGLLLYTVGICGRLDTAVTGGGTDPRST